MDNASGSKVRFRKCFFANKKFILFPEGLIMLVLFYPINLIVVYSLNENKPQFLASFKSVAKQLLIFFGLFLNPSPWKFSSLKKHVISVNCDPAILEYFWKNATHPPVNYYPIIYLYKLYISDGNMIKTKAEGRPNF